MIVITYNLESFKYQTYQQSYKNIASTISGVKSNLSTHEITYKMSKQKQLLTCTLKNHNFMIPLVVSHSEVTCILPNICSHLCRTMSKKKCFEELMPRFIFSTSY
ncbi:hypothetical protein PanWU01x14_330170 [Parasponia andersonii]|uniref:Uncharacterized protein n=1 Tax=Parasponia andersonii TaxID=3476 RepID=A0A2P5AI38_PARAD|nr:hypothetical protein PanWU01x14_330170 [Parasponia andersonii]